MIPRDPRGLRGDAPLLDAWLRFTERVDARALTPTGANGHAVERDLIAAGMPVEMADRDTIVPVVTLADAPGTVARFADTLAAVIERHRAAPRPPVPAAAWTITPLQALPPRDAFFPATKRWPLMPR